MDSSQAMVLGHLGECSSVSCRPQNVANHVKFFGCSLLFARKYDLHTRLYGPKPSPAQNFEREKNNLKYSKKIINISLTTSSYMRIQQKSSIGLHSWGAVFKLLSSNLANVSIYLDYCSIGYKLEKMLGFSTLNVFQLFQLVFLLIYFSLFFKICLVFLSALLLVSKDDQMMRWFQTCSYFSGLFLQSLLKCKVLSFTELQGSPSIMAEVSEYSSSMLEGKDYGLASTL